MAEVQAQAPAAQTSEKDPEVVPPHHDSEEYESAEEVYEEDEEEIEEVEVEEEEEVEEDDELQAGGERDLDDDEDRKNPQFIPKKGYFYEHDDRTQAEEEDENEEKEEPTKEQKPKKVTKEADRWSHDLYDETEQVNKSKEEIVATYGYDIRAEDQPPKAVRRRRYGRDPRKYTRKSDDAEAYRKPRGNYRGGRGRRGGGSGSHRGGEGYEEDFPALQKSSDRGEIHAPADGLLRNQRDSNRGRSDSRGGPGGRGGPNGKPPPQQRTNRAFDSDRDRDDSQGFRDSRNYNSERGGRGGGGGGGGRGRRSEFTNRNRYRDRRDNYNEAGDGGRPFRLDHNVDRGDMRHENRRSDYNERGGRVANGSSGADRPRNDASNLKPAKPLNVAPFTNTEYTGSASLTSQKNGNANHLNTSLSAAKGELQKNINGTDVDYKKNIEARGEPREQREPRDRRAQSKPFQNDRRSQIPPRLQQQIDPATVSSGKPKKFSTQRQRQVMDSPVQQSSVPPQLLPQVVPVQTPVVSGQGPIGPSPVPNYTPQQPYYEPAPGNFENQVYETAGSPMGANGPSVSPSLWGPHAAAFATAPYPSPPTGTQVQVQQQPYADPAAAAYIAAAQQPGPPIYAAAPQFIQDPNLLNFAPPPGPQYAPPFHPQGFQGYAQVTPAPPPEVYHGGVTYYNTHNQIQRPPLVAVQKRPKTVLQLVEPPEKLKSSSKEGQQSVEVKYNELENSGGGGGGNPVQSQSEEMENVELDKNYKSDQPVVNDELISKFKNLQTPDKISVLEVQAESTQPESWSSQVDQMSPTEEEHRVNVEESVNLESTKNERPAIHVPQQQSSGEEEKLVVCVRNESVQERPENHQTNETDTSKASIETPSAESPSMGTVSAVSSTTPSEPQEQSVEPTSVASDSAAPPEEK